MKIKNIQIEVLRSEFSKVNADIKIAECNNFDQEAIRKTISEAFSQVQDQQHKTILFSDLGCQDSQFPLVGVAKIMVQEMISYARNNESPSLEKISVCVDDEATFQVFDRTIRGYINHMLDKLAFGPYPTTDIIIELDEGIILIERSNPPYGWALPGGFLDYGESLEEAAIREAKEETNMDLEDLRQFHTYSKPGRDPRFQSVATVFVAKGKGTPQFGDDAKGLKVVKYDELLDREYAFDHKQIIEDYLNKRC